MWRSTELIATLAFLLFQVPSFAIAFSTGTSKSTPEAEWRMTFEPFFTTLPKGLPRAVSR